MSSRGHLWSRQLQLQVRLTNADDISFLKRLSEFRRAKEVLEIGCGNGLFLSEIAKSFPKKHFVGIDVNGELLASACTRSRGRNNLRFLKRDIYQIKPAGEEFDFIVVRLLIQHLCDLRGFVRIASSISRRNGCILIMEAEDRLTHFYPNVPSARRLFRNIREKQPLGGPQRALRLVRQHARAHDLRLIKNHLQLYKTKGSPREKSLVVSMFSNVEELARDAFQVSVNSRRLRSELAQWKESRDSTFQWGFRFVLLRKGGGKLRALLSALVKSF